jgi:Mrp family chromosome partitioning ATPase
VPSTPGQAPWTSQDIQRFFNLIDYLKEQFAVVIIDLPPILGLAETIRLSIVADSIVLIIRWGCTERQFVQFALDALRSAGVIVSAAILNDIDVKSQQRRGFRDLSVVYADESLYRAAPEKKRGLPSRAAVVPVVAGALDANPETDGPSPIPDSRRNRSEPPPVDGATTATTAGSDIRRLYDRYLG